MASSLTMIKDWIADPGSVMRMTTHYLPAFAERTVPRYTSYPTAAEFGSGVGPCEAAEALAAIPPGAPISLYVHIPYCRRICFYCACNTGRIGASDRLERYIRTLEREAEIVARLTRGRVASIHFGGGSPNALAPGQFEQFVAHLRSTFACADAPEIAVELDPRFVDSGYAQALARASVARASLGVQTFAPHVQAAIGRVQPYESVSHAVHLLRDAGITKLSFDLMYGLPDQTLSDVAETIERALRLQPDRIAFFGYAHVPSVQPRQKAIDASSLPDGPARFAQAELAFAMLKQAGLMPIGFDHFARPADRLAQAATAGKLRRNFQGFTDEPGIAIVGLGASSISQFDGLIVQNHKHEAAYRQAIDGGMLAACRGVVRAPQDRMRGEAIERLLCDGRVDLEAVAARHGARAANFASAMPRLAELEAAGIVVRKGWTVRLSDLGRPYARLAASAFDAWRDGSAGQFSRAV